MDSDAESNAACDLGQDSAAADVGEDLGTDESDVGQQPNNDASALQIDFVTERTGGLDSA